MEAEEAGKNRSWAAVLDGQPPRPRGEKPMNDVLLSRRNMWNVWRTVLEENEKLARARLAAVEVFQQNVIEDAKALRLHKLQVARKVSFSTFYAKAKHNRLLSASH